jgi:UPF0755 protein
MIRGLLALTAAAVLCAAIVGAWLWRDYRGLVDSALIEGEAADGLIWIESGDTMATLAATLETLGLTESDWRWRLLGRLRDPVIRIGEYPIRPGDTPLALLERLERGDVLRHRFTIVEGWTLQRLRAELAADPRIATELAGVSDDDLMRRLECEACFAEGRFLPETYQFVRGDSDLDLLRRAYLGMQRVLVREWENRRPGLPLETPDELLVMASLIEMETMKAEERERVAGVFVRRLERGMRLQTDPTVVYGLGDAFDGRIRRRHLRTDHPWNTYTRHGLPPTPIGLPGTASIHAAAHPADGKALYFVARGDGSHHFSATLAEHNRAVARYVLGRE